MVKILVGLIVLGLANLSGCAVTPKPIIDVPMTARPKPEPPKDPADPGAIFQSGAYRPLFEDVRARAVGDTIVITIAENTNTTTSNANSTSKSAATSYEPTGIFGASAGRLAKLGVTTATKNSLTEKGGGSFANTFSGTISTTVTEVLPNGNLKVSGEKKLGFDRGTEYVRFSGIVAPATIGAGNTVASTQVADAKFEYRTNAHIDSSEMMSILDRFFLSLIPF